jgi:hypothetical protein
MRLAQIKALIYRTYDRTLFLEPIFLSAVKDSDIHIASYNLQILQKRNPN